AVGLDDRDAARAVGEAVEPLELRACRRLPLAEERERAPNTLLRRVDEIPDDVKQHLALLFGGRRRYQHSAARTTVTEAQAASVTLLRPFGASGSSPRARASALAKSCPGTTERRGESSGSLTAGTGITY